MGRRVVDVVVVVRVVDVVGVSKAIVVMSNDNGKLQIGLI
jgi:hypothetical protein